MPGLPMVSKPKDRHCPLPLCCTSFESTRPGKHESHDVILVESRIANTPLPSSSSIQGREVLPLLLRQQLRNPELRHRRCNQPEHGRRILDRPRIDGGRIQQRRPIQRHRRQPLHHLVRHEPPHLRIFLRRHLPSPALQRRAHLERRGYL